jgi:thymidylate synthase
MDLKKDFVNKILEKDKGDEWVKKWWELWPVYGHQWRNFNTEGVDQLKNAIEQIQNNPTNRRIIVSAWNPAQIDDMLLPPCHAFFQFNVDTTNKKLNVQLYQRSADMFLWVPFNIASYSVMLIMFAKITWLRPGTFTHTLWDAHVYNNHINQVEEQLKNEPLDLPELKINKEIKNLEDIEKLEWSDFELLNYKSHQVIRAPVAV